MSNRCVQLFVSRDRWLSRGRPNYEPIIFSCRLLLSPGDTGSALAPRQPRSASCETSTSRCVSLSLWAALHTAYAWRRLTPNIVLVWTKFLYHVHFYTWIKIIDLVFADRFRSADRNHSNFLNRAARAVRLTCEYLCLVKHGRELTIARRTSLWRCR